MRCCHVRKKGLLKWWHVYNFSFKIPHSTPVWENLIKTQTRFKKENHKGKTQTPYFQIEISDSLWLPDETERGNEDMEKEAEKERRWNQKVSKTDFADPKPRQNGKQRRHGVGTGEREKSAIIKRERAQSSSEPYTVCSLARSRPPDCRDWHRQRYIFFSIL